MLTKSGELIYLTYMKQKMSINYYKKRRETLLKKLGGPTPFLGSSSLVLVGRVCGYPNCACAKGKRHPTYYLTWKENKKTHTIYVPKDMLAETREWIREYKRIRKVMKQMNEIQRQILRGYVRDKKFKEKKQL